MPGEGTIKNLPKGEGTIKNGQWAGDSGQGSGCRVQNSSFIIHHSAFTLIELLVTITIIGILAGMALGALRYARTAAAEAQTKATIAKLNDIVMKKYESYMTRRLPINTSGMKPKDAGRARLDAIRDLMRMEMPDARSDIINPPINFSWETTQQSIAREPALHKIYAKKPPLNEYDSAQALFMIVSMGNPESMEQFSQNEIGVVTEGQESRQVFVDGWNNPIMFLRWAPAFCSGDGLNPNPFNPLNPDKVRTDLSDIQTGNPIKDHDPFDNRNLESDAYRLIPLIYSAGHDKVYGLDTQPGKPFSGNPFQDYPNLGTPNKGNAHVDNIHNHRIEQQ